MESELVKPLKATLLKFQIVLSRKKEKKTNMYRRKPIVRSWVWLPVMQIATPSAGLKVRLPTWSASAGIEVQGPQLGFKERNAYLEND